jgi:hypothetical protein
LGFSRIVQSDIVKVAANASVNGASVLLGEQTVLQGELIGTFYIKF